VVIRSVVYGLAGLLLSLFAAQSLHAAPRNREVGLNASSFWSPTSSVVRHAKKRYPLYCVFPDGKRRGVPGIIVGKNKRTGVQKFRLLTKRSTPKLPSKLAAICLQEERPCKPKTTLTQRQLTVMQGEEIAVPMQWSVPGGCPAPIELSLRTVSDLFEVQTSDSSLTIAASAGGAGTGEVILTAENALGQRTVARVAVTVEDRPRPLPTSIPTSVPTSTPTPTPLACQPLISVAGIATGAENQPLSVTISSSVPTGCGAAPTITIVQTPEHGTATLNGSELQYTPSLHFNGTDSVAVEAQNDRGETLTRSITLTIVRTIPEFAGLEDELNQYRDDLSPREVKHLLCKFALCGNKTLYDYGKANGRAALTSVLLSYDTAPATAAVRADFTARTGAASPEAYGLLVGDSSSPVSTACPISGPLWDTSAAQNYWISDLVAGDPLRNHIAIHLHHQAPVNMDVNANGGLGGGCSSHWSYKGHVDLLRVHALGRPGLPNAVNGSYREFITDLLTDYQMGLFLSHVQPYEHPYGWHAGLANTNFGRELMQVFTLGPLNVFTGAPNYSTDDVREVSRALAGNINLYSSDLRQVPQLQARPWRLSNNNSGRWFGWSAPHRDAANKLIFENIPEARRTGNLAPPDVVEAIFQHPGVAYVPRSLFYRSVYPSTTNSVVEQLADQFRSSDFSLRELYSKFMNSSAVFSPKGRSACVATGSVHLMRLIRVLGLRVTDWTSNTSQGRGYDGTFGQIVSLLMTMGDPLLQAPSIFGYNECGDTDGSPDAYNYGQGQLTTQLLLGRFNAPFALMQYYLEGNYVYSLPLPQEGFSINELLPSGNTSPTPTAVIEEFEDRFGVDLNNEEFTIVRNYLDPTDGTRPRWNGSDETLVKARVANLVAIFANLPSVNVR
jgi:hypothetical protein